MSVPHKIAWWIFLARYRVARWRGKAWASGPVRPEWLFAYGRARTTPIVLDAPKTGETFGYLDHDQPVPRVWGPPRRRCKHGEFLDSYCHGCGRRSWPDAR